MLAVSLTVALCAALAVTQAPGSAASPSRGPGPGTRLATDVVPRASTFAAPAWKLTGLGSFWTTSPVVATIDGTKAVVAASLSGEVYVVNAKTGRELPGWPQFVHIHSSTPTAVDSSPAVAYLDGPASPPSIIVGAGSLWRHDQQGGVEAFNANGSVRFVFQTKKTFNPWGGPDVYSDPVFATPAVGDITGSGQLDIVFGSYDHYMYALTPSGALVHGFPVQRADTIWSSPTLADVTHTGKDDIIEGGDSSGFDGCFGGWVDDYRYSAGAPHLAWQRCVGETVWSSPTVAVINSTNRPAVLVGTSWNYQDPAYIRTAAATEVLAFYADDGASVPGWPVHTDGPTFGSPVVGHLDGQLAVVEASCAHCDIPIPISPPLEFNKPATVNVWNGAGKLLFSRALNNHEQIGSPILVDLSGGHDNGNDIVVGNTSGVYVLSGKSGVFLDNTGLVDSTVEAGCDTSNSPAVSYVPGTGWMMFISCGGPLLSTPGTLVGFKVPVGPSLSNPPAWPTWRANAARTGVADPPPPPHVSCSKPTGGFAGFGLAQADGAIYTLGDAKYCGGLNRLVLPSSVVSIATTRDGGGYWLLLKDGSVYAFGDATFYGDLRGSSFTGGPVPPGAPAVAIAASASGSGYYLAAADGSVYAFGPGATYRGSRGGLANHGAIVGITVDQSTGGYWLLGSNSEVYGFDAPGGALACSGKLPGTAVAMSAVRSGSAYWVALSNGSVCRHGAAARFYGSAAGVKLRAPIVGIIADSAANGYWLFAGDGSVFRYGSAAWYGSAGRWPRPELITSVAPA